MNESPNRGRKNINIRCEVLTDKLNIPVHSFILFPPFFYSWSSYLSFQLLLSCSSFLHLTLLLHPLFLFFRRCSLMWADLVKVTGRGERGWVWKGRTRQGETFKRKMRKVGAQTKKKTQRRMKTKNVNWCVRKKKRQGKARHMYFQPWN